MFSEIKNYERIPLLASEIRSTFSATCIEVLALNLRQADGISSTTDIYSAAYAENISQTQAIHTKAISRTNDICAYLDIEPPAIVQDESKRRITSVTGNVLRYALDTTLSADDLVRAAILERYILTGDIYAEEVFSQEICSAVVGYVHSRVYDSIGNRRLDTKALQRLQQVDAYTVLDEPLMISGVTEIKDTDGPVDTTTSKLPEGVLQTTISKNPIYASLYERILQYVKSNLDNLDEADWDTIEEDGGAFIQFIEDLSYTDLGEVGSRAKLVVLADAVGLKLARKAVADPFKGKNAAVHNFSRRR